MLVQPPADPQRPAGPPQGERRLPQTALANGTLVALVEDDDDIRDTLTRKLERAGYQVLAYSDAELALRDMEGGRRPELILLDLMMPGMDGWHFRVEQRKRPSLVDVPVLAMSGDTSAYAEAIDASAYLTKPVDFDRLRTVMEQVLLVSERKRLSTKAMEFERMRTLGMLVAGVAHEINNPLTYVSGNLELARMKCRQLESEPARAGELAGDIARVVDAADEGATRIAFVVRLLSTFARAEPDDLSPTDPWRALDAALRLAAHHVHARARLCVESTPVPLVIANEARLAQVFLNLLVNAAQAIKEGAPEDNEIRVRSHCTAEDVVIEIEDTGVGIAQELISRIFEAFYTTKPVGTGTGLGLSISREIVQSMGGWISVESALGKGSTFYVRLPIAREPAQSDPSASEDEAAAGESSSQEPPVGTRARTILVVDDEASIGRLITAALHGDRVEAVTSPSEGLDRLSARAFDLVLCDLNMPGMNGVEFFHELCVRRPDLQHRFAIMTGSAVHDEVATQLDEMHCPVLLKPFSIADLESCVANAHGG